MLQIFDVDQARRGILKRKILEDYSVPPAVADRLKALFGAPITPAEAAAIPRKADCTGGRFA